MFGRGKKEQGEKEGRDRGGWEREEKKKLGKGDVVGLWPLPGPNGQFFFLPFRPRPKEPFFFLFTFFVAPSIYIRMWMNHFSSTEITALHLSLSAN